MLTRTILILGHYESGYDVHDATREAILAAASAVGVLANTRWMGAEDVALYPGLLAEADGVVLVPPSPHRSQDLPLPLLGALERVRVSGTPFLATGSAHALVFIEVARNVLNISDATSADLRDSRGTPVIFELGSRGVHGRSLGNGRRLLPLERTPSAVTPYEVTASIEEISDTLFGLNPDYASAIEETGLRPLLVDPIGGRPFLHGRDDRCFFVAAYLPQLKSSVAHPLFRTLLEASR